MNLKTILEVMQVVSAILIIIFVLIQVRGTGFGRSSQSTSFTRRGVENAVFKATFVVVAIFLISSLVIVFN